MSTASSFTDWDEPTADLVVDEAAESGSRSAAHLAQPAVAPPAPGSVLCSRYVLEEPLGAGGSATVFRAYDLNHEAAEPDRPRIALKMVRTDLHCALAVTERLKREFRLTQLLTHPNIVRAYDLDCDQGRWFMTMELLEGETLASMLKASGGKLPQSRAIAILRACGEALTFAHEQGVVHGDLKPANIFVTRTGEVKILDFGAATFADRERERHLPAASARYASPQVAGGRRPEYRDDIFSFACLAYELLNGRHPFGRSPLAARAQGVLPPRAWNLTDKQWYPLEAALSFERDRRPESLRALCAELLPGAQTAKTHAAFVSPAADPIEPVMALRAEPELERIAARSLDNPIRSGVSPLAAVVIVIVLLTTAGVVYFQMEQHPQWSQTVKTEVDQTVQDWRDRLQREQTKAAATATPSPPPAEIPPAQSMRPPLAAATPMQPKPGVSPPVQSEPVSPQQSSLPTRHASSSRLAAANVPALAAAEPIATISFAAEQVAVGESANAAVVTLKRDANMSGRTYVYWRVVPGTAHAGEDYAADAGGRADFADNQPLRAIYVPLMHDSIAEETEQFTLELYDAAPGARIWPVQRITVTIHDDD